MTEGNTVIVIDNGNYVATYAEVTPFKARVIEVDDHEISVKSLSTGKEYELYYHQILETLEIGMIKKMIDMSKHGPGCDLTDILSRFENGKKLYMEDALFNKCVYSLLNGADVYKLLEQVVVMMSEQRKTFEETLMKRVDVQRVSIDKELFDQLMGDKKQNQ